MGELSKIEWTDHTFNPWIGCQKVSAGCDHCYAEAMMDHRYGRVQWGPHGERVRTSSANWRKPFSWAKHAAHFAILEDRRQRVFCASLADWLDNKVPRSWREDLAVVIEETPQLDWLLLTKRIENFEKLSPWHNDGIPENVWLGITCENQDAYNRRWSILSAIPARVRFISYEPAIGPLEPWGRPDWIICGGESGTGARLMDPQWARDLMAACAVSDIPFFMKQMTGKQPIPDDILVRQYPHTRASEPESK